jgi:arginyl-tRNA synthetase
VITDQLAELISDALSAAAADGIIDGTDLPQPELERPRKREHGDWATNVALVAGRGRGNPRAIAEALIERLPKSDLIDRVEVAGPGFLNFHLAPAWLHDVVRRASDPTAKFGRSRVGEGIKINVEYVSANPTGPISVVQGRHAAVGDTLSNLLEAIGHVVTREYYINDIGRQIRLFARSIEAHYLGLHGVESEVPEEGYQGDYVAELAKEIANQVGDSLVDVEEARRIDELSRLGIERMVGQIRTTLDRFGTRHQVWFAESSLFKKGDVEKAISILKERGFIEEQEGAVWFTSSKFGDDKDRVVIRASGQTTYLASDLAYLVDKFERGFDDLIYLWGADHHGTVSRLKGGAQALGFEPDRVEVRLLQIVNLVEKGEGTLSTLKGSKRAGVLVALDDLIERVGVDAARYTFLTRSMDQPLDFDIDAVTEQAPENPVYYVQYAHARICSILRRAKEEGITTEPTTGSLEKLGHPSEDELMRKLASYEEEILEAAERRAPQRITRYCEELAATFTSFYRDCRVITEDTDLTSARLALCLATKSVIADALGLLGVTAPESM